MGTGDPCQLHATASRACLFPSRTPSLFFSSCGFQEKTPLTFQILSISAKPEKVGLLAYQPVVNSPMAYQPVVKSLMAKKHLFFLRLPNVGLPGHPIQFYFRNGAQMIIQILLRDIGADDRAGDMCLRASCLALAHVTSFLCRLPFACVCILNITVTTLVVLLLRGFAKKWALKKTTRQMSGL